MTVAPVTATPPTTTANASQGTGANGSSTSANALNQLSADFNNFLTLLTTQLKNQDPLSPMDSTQFTAQLVAFTGVEQQINTNTKLDSLISVDKGTQLTSGANLIGDVVQAPSSQVNVNADGTASQISYTLPSSAAAVTLTITNSAGAVVSSGNAPANSGANTVTFNPVDLSGKPLPAGAYNVGIQALDQNGQPISNITTSIIGSVTNVTNNSSGTQLSIGSVMVPLASVTSVQKPGSTSGNNTSGTGA